MFDGSKYLGKLTAALDKKADGKDEDRYAKLSGTITRTGDSYFDASKVNEEGVAVFQMAVPVLGEASEARVLTMVQGSDEFEYKNFPKKSLSAATSVNTVCQLVEKKQQPTLPGVFSVSVGRSIGYSVRLITEYK